LSSFRFVGASDLIYLVRLVSVVLEYDPLGACAGVSERVVMEILGHSTLAMVKRYQHVLPGLTVAAAERMDRVMGR
jgi:hypothetical protein